MIPAENHPRPAPAGPLPDDADPRFLSTLSHDLRGGLHSVLLALDMLRQDVLESQPMDQMLADIELARRSLIDAGARAERIVCAKRLQRGVMPYRPADVDVVHAVQNAVRSTMAADEETARRVRVHVPDALHLRTDARLVSELVAGLLDHAIRATRAEIDVWLDDAGTLTVRLDRRWLDGDAVATLSVATADPPFDRPTLGLFVAGAVARMLGTTVQVEGDRGVTVSLPASVATLPN